MNVAKSKLDVEALDMYFTFTSTPMQCKIRKVPWKGDRKKRKKEKRKKKLCINANIDRGFVNYVICCPQWLRIFKLACDLFSKLLMLF